jgi:glutamine synthetase
MIDFNDPKRLSETQNVLKIIQERHIKLIWLQFCDIAGMQKSFEINSNRIAEILQAGCSFDGSSIDGYGQIQESDMVAMPDPSTFAIVPWRSGDAAVGRFLCDIYNPDGSRYEADPRYILQQVINKAKNHGFEFYAAPEIEFFLLKKDGQNNPTKTDLRGYFDADPGDADQLLRREMALYAGGFPGVDVETTHHEGARSQHEIDIRYGPAHIIADACQTVKMIVKVVATRHEYVGTFMPKPFTNANGSGQHVHQSLWKKGINIFYDKKDPNNISDYLRYWIGGQLTYAKEMTAILNSWPNSYKRLVPGYEAPTYIAWGFKNRSMLIRVPNFFRKDSSARCEIRSPDPAGNIYLQLAALLTTGLEGILKKIEPPSPVELNVYKISQEEKDRMGIENLPESFGQALHAFRHSELMRDMLGEKAYKAYLDSRMQENALYNAEVSDWELKRYSEKL